jgi:UDP-N-acetylmuramoyl-L-alanyl-D-glutamate--2,6-diaminopimelate ligase
VLPEAEFIGVDDITVLACSRDSRNVRPGELFVALAGSSHDGHDHAGEAVQRGCAAILAQKPLQGVGVPVCRVPDTHQAYGRLCQALAGYPAKQLKVIGVTGTNGKTTTAYLISSILSTAGYQPGVIGTLGCFDGMEFRDSSLTTPPADELAAAMARMVAHECTHAVMEVSSHALDQARLAGITLDAACVTNVQRDHLDYHHTIRDYRLTKSRVLEYLAGEGFAVLNADDSTTATYLAHLTTPVLTIGVRSTAEITGQMLERYLSEQTFLLMAGSEAVPVSTRMIGTHHMYNCLMAAAVGLAYGIDLDTVVRGIQGVQRVPGRLERIECGQPFGVFVDFAHTPDALNHTLETLREVVEGRLFCVFGAGGDRDREKRPLMARTVERLADVAVITNDNPRSEDPKTILQGLLQGCQRPDAVKVQPDREEAIAWALSQAREGDCVLIAGKGHEKYQIIGNHRIAFDDCEVARRWLYENQPGAVDSRQ